MKPLCVALALLAVQEPPAPDRVERWNQDLDELGRVLSERHKNPFFKIPRDDFFRAVDGVRKRIPELKDHQIAVEFMKLGALIGDGHTAVQPTTLRRYPIWLMWLKDGLFVVASTKDHKDLLKARVVAVGKTPVDEAARAVAAVAASDNASGAKNASANWLTVAEVLAGVGLIDDMDKAPFTIVDAQGKERTVHLAPVAGSPRKVFGFEKDLSISRRLSRARYGVEWLPDSKTLYGWYDSCADAPDRPVSTWCEEALKGIDEKKPERVVLDLRRNGGGNSELIRPLLAGLRKRPAVGKLFVLVDRATYSSAILNSLDLRREFKALLVGLAPGGSPNHYGEIRRYPLPHCKWLVQYSTKFFKLAPEGGDTIAPDIEVEWTAAEFFGGADPALDAAIKQR